MPLEIIAVEEQTAVPLIDWRVAHHRTGGGREYVIARVYKHGIRLHLWQLAKKLPQGSSIYKVSIELVSERPGKRSHWITILDAKVKARRLIDVQVHMEQVLRDWLRGYDRIWEPVDKT